MERNNKGFSLVELMVTVFIIAVLSAIAVPTYNQYRASSRRAEAYTFLGEIRTQGLVYYAELALEGKVQVYTNNINNLSIDGIPGDTYYIYHICNQTAANLGDGLKLDGTPPAQLTTNTACDLNEGFTIHANGRIVRKDAVDTLNMNHLGVLFAPPECDSDNSDICTDCVCQDATRL